MPHREVVKLPRSVCGLGPFRRVLILEGGRLAKPFVLNVLLLFAGHLPFCIFVDRHEFLELFVVVGEGVPGEFRADVKVRLLLSAAAIRRSPLHRLLLFSGLATTRAFLLQVDLQQFVHFC